MRKVLQKRSTKNANSAKLFKRVCFLSLLLLLFFRRRQKKLTLSFAEFEKLQSRIAAHLQLVVAESADDELDLESAALAESAHAKRVSLLRSGLTFERSFRASLGD